MKFRYKGHTISIEIESYKATVIRYAAVAVTEEERIVIARADSPHIAEGLALFKIARLPDVDFGD